MPELSFPFLSFLASVFVRGGLKMSTKTLTDEDLVKLYQDPNFMGSYGGMSNFKHFLYTDYGEVSYHYVPYDLYRQTKLDINVVVSHSL